MNNWINVNDRLPERGIRVLAFHPKKNKICIDWIDGRNSFSFTDLNGNVTYWQPLPEPPKGE